MEEICEFFHSTESDWYLKDGTAVVVNTQGALSYSRRFIMVQRETRNKTAEGDQTPICFETYFGLVAGDGMGL